VTRRARVARENPDSLGTDNDTGTL